MLLFFFGILIFDFRRDRMSMFHVKFETYIIQRIGTEDFVMYTFLFV